MPDKYETVEVELCRDPTLGLGITVAGYVHKKGLKIFFWVCLLVSNNFFLAVLLAFRKTFKNFKANVKSSILLKKISTNK